MKLNQRENLIESIQVLEFRRFSEMKGSGAEWSGVGDMFCRVEYAVMRLLVSPKKGYVPMTTAIAGRLRSAKRNQKIKKFRPVPAVLVESLLAHEESTCTLRDN